MCESINRYQVYSNFVSLDDVNCLNDKRPGKASAGSFIFCQSWVNRFISSLPEPCSHFPAIASGLPCLAGR